MILRVKKHHLSYFRKKAKKCPNEVFAVLLGRRVSPSLIEVDMFKYPKLERSSRNEVVTDIYSHSTIEEDAKADGLQVVADIHSHIDWPPVLSPLDHYELRTNKYTVSGVVSVIKGRTWVNFWEKSTSLPVSVEYY